jgi:hypothetical protein
MKGVIPSHEEKRVVVLQSNYLPWKGYFDLIRQSDLLVFYDDTQYTKNDWRNRNRIKTRHGVQWLTIPCGPHHMHKLIQEVRPVGYEWQRSHWDRLRFHYGASPYFRIYRPFFESFYLSRTWTNLSELNQYLILAICREFLHIDTPMMRSTDFPLEGVKEERLVSLLRKVGATTYLSGPTGRQFLQMEPFSQAGIRVEWMDYSGYPSYRQLFPPFVHEVSIVDLLFNEGESAIQFLEPVKSRKEPGNGFAMDKILTSFGV